MRLIDADATRDDFAKTVYAECLDDKDNIRANRIIDAFGDLPTVEAEPVRHSKWISQNNSSHKFCESCGVGFNIHFYEENDYRFCPYCGAKMDNK